MKQCHPKGRENSREMCVLPPLLGERAGVKASVSSNLIFRVRGSLPLVFFKVSLLTSAATIALESTLLVTEEILSLRSG